MNAGNRKLSDHEHRLLRWMLEHGGPESAAYLWQLSRLEVTPWKCPCGCASLNFQVLDCPEPQCGVRTFADFVFGDIATLSGIFLCEKDGVLSGLEVYGLAGDAPKIFPEPEVLRPFGPEITR